MNALKRLGPALFLCLLVPLVPLWRCVFLGETVGAFDAIRQMAPWNAAAPSQPWDVLQADGVIQFYVWRDLVLSAWGQHQVPLWNPYELGGTPLLANSQSGALYPPHIVLGLLHVATPLAIVLLAWFHLALAAMGVRRLSLQLGASETGALVAGAGFGLSAFMLSWAPLASVITTVAWIPWMLSGVLSLRESPSTRRVGGLALLTGMCILAGHLQFVAYAVMGVMLVTLGFLIIDLIAKAPLRRVGGSSLAVLAALVLGACLASPQLLAVLEYGKFSHRQNTASSEGYEAYLGGSVKPFELANLTVATALGNPRRPGMQVNGQTLSTYATPFVKQGANFAESAITLGPITLLLLTFVPWRRREIWPFTFAGIVALLLAIGTPLNALLYFGVPGWSATGSPGRIGVLFVMMAFTLSALGLGDEPIAKEKFGKLAGAVALAAVIGMFLLPRFAPESKMIDPVVAATQISGAVVSALPLAILGLALAAGLLWFAPKVKWAPALAVIPIVWAFVDFASDILPTAKPLEAPSLAQNLPLNGRIAIVNQPWDLLLAPKAILPPNTAAMFRIHELGGYDSLLHRDTKALLDAVNGQDSAPEANGNMMFIKPKADPAKLIEAGVTEVWIRRPLEQFGAAVEENGVFRYKLKGSGRASYPGGEVFIKSESAQGFDLEASGPGGPVTLRDRSIGPWMVTIDGNPAENSGTTWKEVAVPAGSHRIVWQYQASLPRPTFLAGILVLTILSFIRQRKKIEPSSQAIS